MQAKKPREREILMFRMCDFVLIIQSKSLFVLLKTFTRSPPSSLYCTYIFTTLLVLSAVDSRKYIFNFSVNIIIILNCVFFSQFCPHCVNLTFNNYYLPELGNIIYQENVHRNLWCVFFYLLFFLKKK